MSFDIIEFNNVLIPVLLKRMPEPYYIKGGRAYDAYFKDSTNSSDWDIVTNRAGVSFIETYMTQYASRTGVSIQRNETSFLIGRETVPMVQFGFRDYDIEGDPFLLDILIVEKELHGTPISEFYFMPIIDFISDLIITLGDRDKKLTKYKNSMKPIGPVVNEAKKFNKRYGSNFDITNISSCIELRDISLPIISEYISKNGTPLVSRLFIEEYVEKLRDLDLRGAVTDCIDKYYKIQLESDIDSKWESEEEKTDEDEDSYSGLTDYMSDYFNDIVDGVLSFRKNKLETENISKKYLKTLKRMGNAIDISWENLSDGYKIHLLSRCGDEPEIDLFNLSSTCTAHLSCKDFFISKNTSGCVSMYVPSE
jgi:hypothetical protein